MKISSNHSHRVDIFHPNLISNNSIFQSHSHLYNDCRERPWYKNHHKLHNSTHYLHPKGNNYNLLFCIYCFHNSRLQNQSKYLCYSINIPQFQDLIKHNLCTLFHNTYDHHQLVSVQIRIFHILHLMSILSIHLFSLKVLYISQSRCQDMILNKLYKHPLHNLNILCHWDNCFHLKNEEKKKVKR